MQDNKVNGWLVLAVLLLTGFLLAGRPYAPPELLPPAKAEGIDQEGRVFTTIPVTTSSGTTKVLLGTPATSNDVIYLEGALIARDCSTTAPHDMTLWSWDGGAGTPTQIGAVIPLGVSTSTSPGGFVEDCRGGARRTKRGEKLYFSIDNNAGSAGDCNVSGMFTTTRP